MIAGLNSPNVPLVSGTLDLSATADVWEFAIPFKCEVIQVGLTILNDVGATATVKFDSVQLTTRGDGDVADIDLATSHTAGEFVYSVPATQLVFEAGDFVVVQVTDAAAAGDEAVAVLIIREIPEVAGNNSKMVLTA